MRNQITRRLTTAALTATLMLFTGVALMAAPALAVVQTPFTQGTSLSTLPSGATGTSNSFTFYSTSCGSVGSCYSVGDYQVIGGGGEGDGVVLPITNGIPGTEVEASLPAGAPTGGDQDAVLNSVSCWSAASCIAVGYYVDSTHTEQGLVVPITNGVVGTGIEVSLPSSTDYAADLDAVSCWSAGSCVAIGSYYNSSIGQRTWTVPITNGVVGSAASVSLPGNASSSASAGSQLSDVSCAATGSCVAVGDYTDSRGDEEALVVPYSGGTPSAGLEVSEPANAASLGSQDAQLQYVDCPSAGACTAIGTYDRPSSDGQPLEAQITNGTPGAGTELPLPSNAVGEGEFALNGFSCASTVSCVAVGYYTTTSGGVGGLAATITNDGVADTGVTLPADAGGPRPYGPLYTVSCVPSGTCVAAGDYFNAAEDYEAMTVPISGASVGAAIGSPAPANESTSPPDAQLDTIGCASSGSCAAVGAEENTSGAYQPYVLSLEPPLAIGTASLSTGALGVPYAPTTLSASGGWGAYTWTVNSGSLPAGLSLNAQTGVISGTPTAAGDASFTVQVSAAGVPTQTATQSLTINVPTRTTSTPSASEQILLAPAVSEAPGALQAKTNRVTVGLSCLNATCSGPIKLEVTETLTVKHGKKQVHKHQTVVIGSASYSLAAGKSEDIGVTLNALGRKLLDETRHHRLSVTVLATATGGNLVTRRTTLTETVKKKTKEKRTKKH